MSWMIAFKMMPERAEFVDYVKRVTSRPSFKTVAEMDAKKAAEHEAAAAKAG
jgi:hypothetical protein